MARASFYLYNDLDDIQRLKEAILEVKEIFKFKQQIPLKFYLL